MYDALLGQVVPTGGEVLIGRLSGDDAAEVRLTALGLRSQDAPEALRLLLSAAERPDT